MITLFDEASCFRENKNLRDAYHSRLEEIFGSSSAGVVEETEREMPAESPEENSRIAQSPDVEDARPPADHVRAETESSDAFKALAEQISHSLMAALADALGKVTAAAQNDHQELEDTARTLAETVQELGNLNTVVGSLQHAVDALTQAGRGMYYRLSELEGKLEAAEKNFKDQQELMAEQAAEAEARASEINSRVEVLDRNVQAQTEETLRLRAASSELQSGFSPLERRLDSQAEAIRILDSTVRRFQGRLVEKIREIADGFGQPQPSPKDPEGPATRPLPR